MASMAVQQFCLRWNNHQPNFISVFTNLLTSESLVDVTLAAEGKQLQAHKVVLSACSTYFQSLFTTNPCQHPIVILKDIKYCDLKTMVDFMYYGEVNVSQEQLPAILKTAETLKIKGLAEMPDQLSLSKSASQSSDKCESPSPISPSVLRRKRLRKSSTGSGSEQTSEETAASGSGSGTDIVASPIKLEPEETVLRKEPSTESEQRDSSHSFEEESYTPRNLSEEGESNIRWSSSEEATKPGTSTVQPQVVEALVTPSMGSKRGRLLMRQHRIKKESEMSQLEGDGDSPKIERQYSEPTPNLLSVPQQSYLIKQNSSPHLTTTPAPTSQPVQTTPTPTAVSQPGTTEVTLHQQPQKQRLNVEELRRAVLNPQCLNPSEICEASRSCHCPVLRPGPALGCNFCWNTIDTHGRILRRKTKYHCPECQTNLCIVPCFQEYHEQQCSNSSQRDIPPTCTSSNQGTIPTITKTFSL
ncbi:protein tramtrack, beta isoform-like isoform X1 [Cimex lectularius]|uniref:BTB domain-containing protein n=1 Tax=Cimex lectularius TaxID=79782 RepID=A0A8I6RYB9_CIMLE|nr:protein tramtrack, beta isoform-like isoform X1 [Cimex lectularius]XP_014252257.1 protein tramtrack, beta isoform-like isoform X1 [Cimex lectularius]